MTIERVDRQFPHQRHPHRRAVHKHGNGEQDREQRHQVEVALAGDPHLRGHVDEQEQQNVEAHDEDETAHEYGHEAVRGAQEAVSVARIVGRLDEDSTAARIIPDTIAGHISLLQDQLTTGRVINFHFPAGTESNSLGLQAEIVDNAIQRQRCGGQRAERWVLSLVVT